jgi:hypothetical protein
MLETNERIEMSVDGGSSIPVELSFHQFKHELMTS